MRYRRVRKSGTFRLSQTLARLKCRQRFGRLMLGDKGYPSRLKARPMVGWGRPVGVTIRGQRGTFSTVHAPATAG